jgi:hypothetical protein
MKYPSDTSNLQYEIPTKTWVHVDTGIRYGNEHNAAAATAGFVLFFAVLLVVSLALSLAVFTQLESSEQNNDELRAFAASCVEEADTCHTTCVEYLP